MAHSSHPEEELQIVSCIHHTQEGGRTALHRYSSIVTVSPLASVSAVILYFALIFVGGMHIFKKRGECFLIYLS